MTFLSPADSAISTKCEKGGNWAAGISVKALPWKTAGARNAGTDCRRRLRDQVRHDLVEEGIVYEDSSIVANAA